MSPHILRKRLFRVTALFAFLLVIFFPKINFAFAYQTWSPSINISDTPTSSVVPAIAVDKLGNLYMIWAEFTPPDITEIYYSTKPAGGTWSLREKIPSPLNKSYWPQLAIDSNNTVHAVWFDGTYGFQRIYYAFKPLNGAWSEPVAISQSDNFSHYPSIVIDNLDAIHVGWSYTVWSPTLPQQNDIFYAFKPNGGFWSNPINVSNTGTNSYSPALTVDGSNNIYIIWVESISPSNFDIFYSQKISDSTWAMPTNISNTPFGPNPWPPRLASDTSGNLHALWAEDEDNGMRSIFYATKSPSGWSPTEKLSTTFSGSPDISADVSGTVHVVWSGEAVEMKIHYINKQPYGMWSAASQISQLPAHSFMPSVAVDTQNLYVAFMNNSPGNDDIFFTTSKIPYKVTWLPPLSTQEIYTMHDGATLPVNFGLTNPDGSQVTDAAVTVVIKENATGIQWFSGLAVYDSTLPGYSIKVSTKGWPLGEYTITLLGDRLVHNTTYGLILVDTGVAKGKAK